MTLKTTGPNNPKEHVDRQTYYGEDKQPLPKRTFFEYLANPALQR